MAQLSQFERLPTEIHTEIFIRLARYSRLACRNLLAAAPTIGRAANDPRLFRVLNIEELTIQPLAARNGYHDLMSRCLANGNLQAHYVRGILEYFRENNIEGGLAHLQIAAEGSYKKAVYLYCVIMMARGEMEIGKPMLDSLGWRQDPRLADACWRRIKRALHRITVTRLHVYIETYMSTRATIECHINDIHTRCDNYFYYKQITKFVFMI